MTGRVQQETEITEGNEDCPEIGNGLIKQNYSIAYADKESFSSVNYPTNSYRSTGPV